MKVWVFIDGRQQGPFEKEELSGIPGFNENTKVWYEGLPKWYPAGSLDEFSEFFDNAAASAECVTEDYAASSQAFSESAAASQVRRTIDEPCPPTYVGLSVFLLICCCSPVSAAALVASICTSSLYAKGNLAGSKKASEVAAWLIMAAIALGFIPVMLMSAIF